MKANKKSTIQCHNCETPLPRQNYNKYLSRCKDCFKIICNSCKVQEKCNECFIKSNSHNEMIEYYDDKLFEGITT